MSRKLIVNYGEDHHRSLPNCKPLEAITELIWNALDADAKHVNIEFRRDGIGTLQEIILSDDGHGIAFDTVDSTFGWIGASPKRQSDRTPCGRPYHGQHGKGRYKAFSLGSLVTWESRFRNGQKSLTEFLIKGFDSSLLEFDISDSFPSKGSSTGVTVRIANIKRQFRTLDVEIAIPQLSAIFAPYLIGFPGTHISYDRRCIDPQKNFRETEVYPISVFDEDEGTIQANLRIYEWKEGSSNDLYLCDEKGVVIEKVQRSIRPGVPYSAYFCSEYFAKTENLVLLEDATTPTSELISSAKKKLRDHFREKQHSALAGTIQELRKDEAYPYEGEPKDLIEQAERQVFDICAGKIIEFLPEFIDSETQQKKLTLRLVKEGLERNPSSLQTILKEVFNLPKQQQDEFADLLQKTSLSAILNVSKTVAERLKFLNGFEQIVNDQISKKHLKERKHLQHILEGELWLFGEQYAFTSPRGGDVSLKTVLESHLRILGRNILAEDVDAKNLTDIPDLCLYRQYCWGKPGEYENLVVELKRPKIPIAPKHISQIEEYAFAVKTDSRFDKEKTKWKFILVNTDLNEMAEQKCEQKDRLFGLIHSDQNCDIWIMRWSQIIQEAKGRLEFVQDQLNYSIASNEEGMNYIREKYSEFLPRELHVGIGTHQMEDESKPLSEDEDSVLAELKTDNLN